MELSYQSFVEEQELGINSTSSFQIQANTIQVKILVPVYSVM